MAENKPTLKEYLQTLAPDFAIADMTEQYGAQHNENGIFNDVFFYYSDISDNDEIEIPFYRALIKYEEADSKKISGLPENNSYTYNKNECKYAIVVSDTIVKLSGVTFACGVGF